MDVRTRICDRRVAAFVDRWPLTVVEAASREGRDLVDGGRWTVDEAPRRESELQRLRIAASTTERRERRDLVDGGRRTVDEAPRRESEFQRLRIAASTTVNGQRSTKSRHGAASTASRHRASSTVHRPPSTKANIRREDKRNERNPRTSEDGFTLAGVLVICTVLMIFVAYTVPRQWSTIMKREREKQTIFVMKQYARSIRNFQAKNSNALPTSLDQLKKARTPRLIRGVKGEWNDPLTGKADWVLVPPQAAPPPPQIRQGQGPGQGGLQTTQPRSDDAHPQVTRSSTIPPRCSSPRRSAGTSSRPA